MEWSRMSFINGRVERIFAAARENIVSRGNFNFPVMGEAGPRHSIDFSAKIPSSWSFSHTKLVFEVVRDKRVEIGMKVSCSPVVEVKVGEEVVRKGFFVKDLYLSLAGGEKFVNDRFLSVLSPSDSVFVSYGVSFLRWGTVVCIPRDMGEIDVFVTTRVEESVFGGIYSMLHVGGGTKVNLCEEVLPSYGVSGEFVFELSEVILEEGADFCCNMLQSIDTESEFFLTRGIVAKGNNNIEFNNVSFGGKYQRLDDKVLMENENVHLRYTGVFLARDDQAFDVITNVVHSGSDQGADVVVKKILDGRARVFTNGVLRIGEGIRRIDSFLGLHALHVSSECKSVSIPSLEVKSFDVKSGHSASLTQIDDEKLFYLRSRGLSEEDAKRVVVQGFAEGAIRRISSESFKARVKDILSRSYSRFFPICDS